MADEPFCNPMFSELLGRLASTPEFPSDSVAVGLFDQFVGIPSDEVVSLIVTDSRFTQHSSLIKAALIGMDIRGIGFSVTRFVDRYFPSLMERINTNESEFELYKAVVIGVADRILGDSQAGVNNDVQG